MHTIDLVHICHGVFKRVVGFKVGVAWHWPFFAWKYSQKSLHFLMETECSCLDVNTSPRFKWEVTNYNPQGEVRREPRLGRALLGLVTNLKRHVLEPDRVFMPCNFGGEGDINSTVFAERDGMHVQPLGICELGGWWTKTSTFNNSMESKALQLEKWRGR